MSKVSEAVLWSSGQSASAVCYKIETIRSLLNAIVQAYEFRYGVERCCEGSFSKKREEGLFVAANALSTSLSVSLRWLETNYAPEETLPVDPMLLWILESGRNVFAEFHQLPWVDAKFLENKIDLDVLPNCKEVN